MHKRKTSFVNINGVQRTFPQNNMLLNHEQRLTENKDILTVLYISHWTAFGRERNSDLNTSQFLTVVKAAKSYRLSTLQSAAMFTSASSRVLPMRTCWCSGNKSVTRGNQKTSGLETGAKIKFVRHYWKKLCWEFYSHKHGLWEKKHCWRHMPASLIFSIIFLLALFDLFQSKKRGLSLEEKRTRLLGLFFEKVRTRIRLP